MLPGALPSSLRMNLLVDTKRNRVWRNGWVDGWMDGLNMNSVDIHPLMWAPHTTVGLKCKREP